MKTSRASLVCFLANLLFLPTLAHGAAPTAQTLNPTNITTNSVTLRGSVNPGGALTFFWFQWGTTTNYGSNTLRQSIGSSNSPAAVQANLSSLLTDTNYHYRLVASNTSGVTYGQDVIVTPTLLLYLYEGESWTYEFHDLPFSGSVYLGGGGFDLDRFTVGVLPGSFAAGSSLKIEAFGNGTNVCCGYGSAILNAPDTGTNCPANGDWFPDLQGVGRITVLTGSVVIASASFSLQHYVGGGSWSFYGHTITPTRDPQPVVLSNPFVSSVGIQTAVVSADIDARNLVTGLFAQWGTTTNYGSATGVAFVNYDYSVRRDITISNLVGGTTYHARLVATNSVSTNYGPDLTFTTGFPASVTTLPAFRGATSAVLNASASLNGAQTTAYFEWGPTTNYGQLTALQDLGFPIGTTNYSAAVTGLLPETTYHYRALVYVGTVTNAGSDVAFTTTPPPTNTVITNLLTQDVQGAIERGGKVSFQTDGTLLLSNTLEIAGDVALDATGHSLVLSGGNSNRIFSVGSGAVLCLTNLTLANGRNANGAAIFNQGGTVRGQGCTFLNNQAFGTNGVNGTNGTDHWGQNCDTNLVFPGGPGGPATSGESVAGGAVFNSGVLDLDNCLFLNNQTVAGNGGTGGVGGRGGTWRCSPVPNGAKEGGAGGTSGHAGSAKGGSIANFGTLLLNRCIFSNSIAAGGAGGNVGLGGPRSFSIGPLPGYPNTNGASSPATPGGAVQGGAIFCTGNSFISNCLFLANQSVSGAGGSGVFVTNYNEGGGSGTNGGLCQGAAIFTGSNSVIAHCTLAGNSARGGDGGTAKTGISGVGGLPRISGLGGFAYGGALALGTNGLVVNCTIVSNRVVGGTGGPGGTDYGPANGGHAFGGGLASLAGATAVNLTVHGNAAFGGGSAPPATNGLGFGGSIASTGGVFQIVNSILSGGTSNNAWGTITDLGHNLSSDSTPVWTSGTSLNNTDPLLLPLANNGGPTMTMALGSGSPAINSADCALAPATDQRGVSRLGTGCDIGAYETVAAFTLEIWQKNAATNVVRHAAEPGRAYRLETTVLFDAWVPVVTNIAPGGGWLEFHVPFTSSPCFYRVVAQ